MKSLKFSRTICGLGVVLGVVWLSLASWPMSVQAAPATSPPRVLILDETVTGGASSQEAAAASLAIPGCAIDIVPAALWTSIPASGSTGPTGHGFDEYRAIIIGDPKCQNGPGYVAGLTALNASKATWSPVCTGNAIIEGVDNAWHALGASFPSAMAGADKTIKRGIAFAVDDATKTGFYYAMSCFYQTTATPTVVPHLAGFGLFKVRGYGGVCFDDAHIVASHPVLVAPPPLTDAELSNWGCSTHEGFDVWPPSFTVLAIALTNGAYTATDGSNGIPYILARGQGLTPIGPITLGPPIATNNLGTTHTVCAAISTNVVPNAGVAITFTISSGPNAVTNFTTLSDSNGVACFTPLSVQPSTNVVPNAGVAITFTISNAVTNFTTALSDSNGVACFTYTGKGGLGIDYLTATYTNSAGRLFSSATVSKLWVDTCVSLGCPVVECLSGGTWSYSFCVTNIGTSPLNFVSLFNPPPGVSFTPGLITLSPPLGSGQSRTVSVLIHGPASLASLCFKIGAHTSDEVTGMLHTGLHRSANLLQSCADQHADVRQHGGQREHLQLLHHVAKCHGLAAQVRGFWCRTVVCVVRCPRCSI